MRRNVKKYFKIASSTYLLGALFICQGAKNSYFFCRAIDDCADGDLEPSFFGFSDFEGMILSLKEIINEEKKPINALEILAYKSASQNKGIIRTYLVEFLDAMVVERNRRLKKIIHSEKELLTIHKKSYGPVIRIAFVAFQTKFNEQIIHDLTLVQSKVYSIQDLGEDIKSGIYNFPSEVNPLTPVSITELKNNQAFTNWVEKELRESEIISTKLLNDKYPKKTKKVIDTLVEPILLDIQSMLND